MKLAYFDCFSGISGDMTLGALVDAGCPVEYLRSELQSLDVSGWTLSAEKVWKNGMAATYVQVVSEDQQKHRSCRLSWRLSINPRSLLRCVIARLLSSRSWAGPNPTCTTRR